MIKPISLLKQDTCYTYALRRTGNQTLCLLTSQSNDAIERIGYSRKKLPELKTGDILVYVNDESEFYHCGKIDAKGRVFSILSAQELHFLVYEGAGIVSDVTIIGNAKEIRLRELKDVSHDFFVLNL